MVPSLRTVGSLVCSGWLAVVRWWSCSIHRHSPRSYCLHPCLIYIENPLSIWCRGVLYVGVFWPGRPFTFLKSPPTCHGSFLLSWFSFFFGVRNRSDGTSTWEMAPHFFVLIWFSMFVNSPRHAFSPTNFLVKKSLISEEWSTGCLYFHCTIYMPLYWYNNPGMPQQYHTFFCIGGIGWWRDHAKD